MHTTLAAKEAALLKFLQQYKHPAVAFSGGVDSSVLLAACKAADLKVQPIMASTPAVPAFEKLDAAQVTQATHTQLITLNYDPLQDEHFRANNSKRCYYCKKGLMTTITQAAKKLGCDVVLDGANADDTGDYRPGMQAAREVGIVSPLLACSITKAEVRALANKYGLTVATKPAYACLASRIAYGEAITVEKLHQVELAEDGLRALGLGNLRVRCHGNVARLEVAPELIATVATTYRRQIVAILKNSGFTFVTLDMEGYRTGSMNSELK